MKRYLFLFLIVSVMLLALPAYSSEPVLTRQELCRVMIEQLEQRGTITRFGITERPFTDTTDLYVQNSYALGLVAGDGQGCFQPDNLVTKEQAVVIMKRLLDYVVPRLIYDTAKIEPITDQDKMTGYAVVPVSMMTSTGVIGGGEFRPGDPVSEDYILTLIDRIYQAKSLPVSRPNSMSERRVPVLMYHKIGPVENENSPNAYLSVKTEQFEEQIKYLSEQGYTFLFPDERHYADQCEKPVIITMDDGYMDNYTNAYPILKKYNAKATIYMIGSYVHKESYLTKNLLKEMAASGLVNIGSHTMSHGDLSQMNEQQLAYEMKESKAFLENIVQQPVTDLSYPYGNLTDTVVNKARQYYWTAVTVNQGNNIFDPFMVRRTVVYRKMDLKGFRDMLSCYP
mgnify:FL=1